MNPNPKEILFIAPIPPPLSGHSLVSEILFKYLSKSYKVNLVNLIKNSTNKGQFTLIRFLSVLAVLRKVLKYSRSCSSIYLTISESFLGSIKDIFIFLILFKKLGKLNIHLHGGSLDKKIFQRFPMLKAINSFFYKRISKVIISGNSHKSIFPMLSENKIAIVPNFVQEELFIEKANLNKFKEYNQIKVLYLSSMDIRKGYLDLLYGIENCSEKQLNLFEFNFAGNFKNANEKNKFMSRIKKFPQIKYHGYIDNLKKKKLLNEAHIFILPTRYFEGQPISILEAYASGCIVLTTKKPGILDIFKPNLNGYSIDEKSPESIKKNLLKVAKNKDKLKEISINNLNIAKANYKEIYYCKKIETLLIS